MPDYVPNMLRCAKCNFELERFTMNANTGAVGVGTNEPERCPNGCGPLWRVTWEQEARYLGQRMNEWADRAIAAEAKLRALGVTPCPESGKHCNWINGECHTCGTVRAGARDERRHTTRCKHYDNNCGAVHPSNCPDCQFRTADVSGLAEFVRNASQERKAEVFGRVMDKVAEQQQAVIDAADGVGGREHG